MTEPDAVPASLDVNHVIWMSDTDPVKAWSSVQRRLQVLHADLVPVQSYVVDAQCYTPSGAHELSLRVSLFRRTDGGLVAEVLRRRGDPWLFHEAFRSLCEGEAWPQPRPSVTPDSSDLAHLAAMANSPCIDVQQEGLCAMVECASVGLPAFCSVYAETFRHALYSSSVPVQRLAVAGLLHLGYVDESLRPRLRHLKGTHTTAFGHRAIDVLLKSS